MFDIKAVEAEARKEILEEAAKAAKGALKAKLSAISKARAIVANLEREYQALLLEVGSDLSSEG